MAKTFSFSPMVDSSYFITLPNPSLESLIDIFEYEVEPRELHLQRMLMLYQAGSDIFDRYALRSDNVH